MPSPRVGCGSLLDYAPPPRLLSTASPSRHLPSQASRWRGLRTPEKTGASLRGSCLAQPRRALGEGGRAGRSPGCAVRPRDRVRTGSARPAPEEEEGNRRSRSWGRGARARAGRKDRERRACGVMCLPAIWSVGRAGVEGGGSGRPARGGRVLPVGARAGGQRGRRGPCRGPGRPRGGAGRNRPGSPGSPLRFPSCFPGPHRRAGASERHSEFPATFPAGGKGAAARRSQDRGQE